MDKCIIIGAGTYGMVYSTFLSQEYEIIGFIDDDEKLIGTNVTGIPVLGNVNYLLNEIGPTVAVFAPLGNNSQRVSLLEKLIERGFNTPSFIHPQSQIPNSVLLGKAVYILNATNIMPFTSIGDFTMISMGVNIAHHVIIDKGCFFSQGSIIGASIKIEELAYFGIASVVMTGLKKIGKRAVIGAGTVVIKDVLDDQTVVGNPARVLIKSKKNENNLNDKVNQNILITSAGQRVSLVKAFQKELKAIVPSAKIITVDANPVLAPACHVADEFEKIPKFDDANYIVALLAICIKWKVKIVIPTIDSELLVLSQNKKIFNEKGITILVSDTSFVTKCRDKRIINNFFTTNGIEIPKAVDKLNPTFPLFIKPYDGSLSKDIFLIENTSQLLDYHVNNPKLMFTEYINPNEYDEYTVDTYYDKKNNLKCIIPRKRIFVRAGEVNKGVTSYNELVTFIKEKLSSINGALGCITMQFFLNKKTKRIVGIEINPRFGGGYPLSYLAGGNFPKWIIEEYLLEQEIPFFSTWENNLLMLRFDDEVLVRNYEA